MRKKGDKMGKNLTLKKERWWGEKERERKIAIENVETQKKLPLNSLCCQLFAAMMGNRVVMVFLV